MSENPWLSRQIDDLRRSMENGFERLQEDLNEVKKDVKALDREAIPHRVRTLESWRDGMGARMWTFLIGCAVASATAWIAVVVRSTA